MRKALLLIPTLLLAGCNWGIKLDSGAKNIRTAWNDAVSACRELGKVTVSVMDRVGPVDRNEIKVASELEVLARNSAAQMQGADTIKPLADPKDGAQPWGVYACGSRTLKAAPARPAGAATSGHAQTFPVQGG
jgi:hypothetical protein